MQMRIANELANERIFKVELLYYVFSF